MSHRLHRPALLAVTALLSAACGGAAVAGPTPEDPPGHDPSPMPLVADWSGPFELSLPGGWMIEDCEGDAPLWCVSDESGHVGAVELGRYPLSEDFGDQDPGTALDRYAEDFVASMQADREIGCSDFEFEAAPTVNATVGGHPAVRTGFSMTTSQGEVVERVIVYQTVADDQMWSVTASAYEADGCLSAEFISFTAADLETFAPTLERLVADTPLPESTLTDPSGGGAFEDGAHEARMIATDAAEGTVTLDRIELLTGQEAVDAAHADGELPPEEASLPNDFYLRDRDSQPLTLPVATDATVTVYDCSQECERAGVSVSDLLSGAVTPFGGPNAIFALVIADGQVTELREIYLP